MARIERRPMNLLDAMVLIAATALALLAIRWYGPIEFVPDSYSSAFTYLKLCFHLMSFPAAAWTLALFFLRLRRPRPPLRRLLRQPGAAACTAVLIVLAIRTINLILVLGAGAIVAPGRRLMENIGLFLEDIFQMGEEVVEVPAGIGCAVAAVWAVQILSAQWRAEPSWIDRLGRLLGLFWLATIPFGWFYSI
jgi:hypothetical protein